MEDEKNKGIMEEEDDWNPDPYAPSVLKKNLVDITERLEEEEEENYKFFGTLNFEEFKKEALANQASKDADLAKRVEEMKKNIPRDPDQPVPKKRKNHLMRLIDKATKKTSKKGTKATNQPEKDVQIQEEKVSSSDDDDEDDENNMMYEIKNKVEGAENPFTENLYDPIQDDKYNDWVDKKLRKDKASSLVLSCPFCFIQLCYDSQKHEAYENQYRAVFVKNCKVDSSKPLKFSKEQEKKDKKSKKKRGGEMEEQDPNDYSRSFEDVQPKDFEYFFPVHCNTCNTEVGVYDFEEKIYHFFSVVPSLG